MFALLALAPVAVPASAAAHTRIVLADRDPELANALKSSLAPWEVELFVDPEPVPDDAAAIDRSDRWHARFVVWREGAHVVVFDRDRAQADRRDAIEGAFDPATAMAAALTVKTMLRLPDDQRRHPADESALDLRVAIGGGGRIAFTDGGGTARQSDAVMVRVWRDLWLGMGVQYGTSIAVARASFAGKWNDVDVDAIAAWSIHLAERFELVPAIGIGLAFSHLSGEEGKDPRDESATDLGLLTTIAVYWHVAPHLHVLGEVGLHITPSAPSYERADGKQMVFQAPEASIGLGIGVVIDLDR